MKCPLSVSRSLIGCIQTSSHSKGQDHLVKKFSSVPLSVVKTPENLFTKYSKCSPYKVFLLRITFHWDFLKIIFYYYLIIEWFKLYSYSASASNTARPCLRGSYFLFFPFRRKPRLELWIRPTCSRCNRSILTVRVEVSVRTRSARAERKPASWLH